MSFNEWQSEISEGIETSLSEVLPHHNFKEVIKYSVFPTGKLFRPLLVYSLAKDLGTISPEHKVFSHSVELHHTYTLIHDDLPAMDDDDMRRGRASSHIKFSEWQAILAGDALISSSYELLAKISEKALPALLQIYGEYTGGKGLILGQVMDLGNENKTLESLLLLHELKTGRLIQLCLEGVCIISNRKELQAQARDIGKCLGINFQLLDDLCELTEEIGSHEKDINPFLHYDQSELFQIINKNKQIIEQACADNQFNQLMAYIQVYYEKVYKKLKNGITKVNKHITIDINEIDKLLK